MRVRSLLGVISAVALSSHSAWATHEITAAVMGAGATGGISADYAVASTLGQIVVGVGEGQHFTVKSGFWGGGALPSSVSGGQDPPIGEGPAPPVTDASSDTLPRVFGLTQVMPSPFAGEIAIHFDVPEAGGGVSLRIYDVQGAVVRTLFEGRPDPGRRTVVWSGRDDAGQRVSSGVYFLFMEAPAYRAVRRVLLLR